MSVPVLIGLLTFATVLTVAYGIYEYTLRRRFVAFWRGRLRLRGAQEGPGHLEATIAYLRLLVLTLLHQLGHVTSPREKKEISKTKRLLTVAGYRKPNAVTLYYGSKVGLAILLPLSLFLIPTSVLKSIPAAYFGAIIVGAAVVGLQAPTTWVQHQANARKQRLLNGFPDVLDLLVVCVEAGLGLDAAIARVGHEMRLVHTDLSDEFNALALELRAGVARQEALRNLANRVDLEEVKGLVALLIQTDRFGTSVAQALRVHSDSLRKHRHLRAEEKAAKLPVKLVFPLIFFIFPSLFIVVIGPAIVRGIRELLPALQGSGG